MHIRMCRRQSPRVESSDHALREHWTTRLFLDGTLADATYERIRRWRGNELIRDEARVYLETARGFPIAQFDGDEATALYGHLAPLEDWEVLDLDPAETSVEAA